MAINKGALARLISLLLVTALLLSIIVITPANKVSAAADTSKQLFGIVVKATGKALDVDGFSKLDGAKVQQWNHDSGFGINQRWYLVPAGQGYFGIVNFNSGKCLDVDGASTSDGANVNQWNHDAGFGTGQQWKLEDAGDGWYKIVNKNSNKYLTIQGNGTNDGARLQQNTYAGSNWQKFRVAPYDNVKIINRNSGKAACIEGALNTDGAIVHQWDYTGEGLDQQWHFDWTSEGYYGIVNRNSGKALEVEASSTADGAKVQQWNHTAGFAANQQWRLAINDDGYFSLVNRNSSKALDVSSSSADNGAAIVQWDWVWPGGNNQQWSIEQAETIIKNPTGLPVFKGSGAADEPVGYTTNSMLSDIYTKDLATGDGTSFWMDRMLARYGNDPSIADSTGNMLSKGRSIWMGWHDSSKLGFAGEVAYIDDADADNASNKNDGVSAYTIDLNSGAFTEDVSQRISYPSYWTSEYNNTDGLNVKIRKFFTENNVAVSVLDIKNTSASAKNITMTVSSPRAAAAEGNELVGQFSAPRGLTTVYPKVSGDGLTAGGSNLTGSFSIAAGQTVSKKVVMGYITKEIPESAAEYSRFKGYTPENAFVAQVREYNKWWAENIPYIDVPDENIKKMIYYRWWIERFNVQDDALPLDKGYAFPTSVEGVLGYNNAITLSIPWQLEESRYFRNPDLNYGTWLSVGATSGGGAFKDNPGSTPYWPNEENRSEMKPFSQYISKAGWESYKVFGGQNAILSKFADYGYGDVKDFMARYDKNNNYIVALPDGSFTGFDADSPVTKYFNNVGGTGGSVESLCSAYNYASAKATAEMYSLVGNTAKADEMNSLANNIQAAVLNKMWDSTKQEFLHKDVNSDALNPWKDITNFYPFTMGLVPTEDTAYREMLKLWTNPNDFVVWPAYIGDIQDSQAAAAEGRHMSFNFAPCSIGVNLSFLAAAIKQYPSAYITPDLYKKQLYWGTWAGFVDGNTDYPDANEFWSNGSLETIDYRSWIHHNQHSKYNVSIIEDAAGFTPRIDNSVELNPIDIGWGHFTINNLRYHGSDLTIVWNGDSYYSGIQQGYSLFVDGTRMFTADSLTHLIWNSATGEVTFPDGTGTASYSAADTGFLSANEVTYTNGRVVDMFKVAGVNIAGTTTASGISVDPGEMTLYSGQTNKITAFVEPADAINQNVTWESSDPNIAVVDAYGNVTGVTNGNATVSAITEDGGFKASCSVTVRQATIQDLSQIKLDKNRISIGINKSETLSATVESTFNNLTNLALNKNKTGFPKPSASFTNGSDSVWNAVDGDAGSSKRWTAWNSGNSADWYEMDFGSSQQVNRLELEFFDDGGGVQPPKSYQVMYWDGSAWTNVGNISKTPDIAAAGVNNVVYFDEVNTQKIRVVMANKDKIDWWGPYVGLNEIRAFYDRYYGKTVNWNSEDTGVATVDANGNVQAVAPGTATITAKTVDDLHQAHCEVTVVPLPAAPADLTATAAGISAINLAWLAVPEVSGYNVYRSVTQDGTYSKLAISPVTGTTFNDTGLSAATTYYYKVTALNIAGESTESAIANARTDNGSSGGNNGNGGNTPPTTTASGISVDPSEMTLYLGQTNKVTAIVEPAEATNQNVTWESSDPNVAVVDAYGNVLAVAPGTTTIAAITVDGLYQAHCAVTVVSLPAAPAGLTATAAGIGAINLAWSAVPEVSGYNVYRSVTQNGSFTKLTISPVTDTTYNDTGLSAATTYYYKVTALNMAGESAESAIASARTDSGSSGGNNGSGGNNSSNSGNGSNSQPTTPVVPPFAATTNGEIEITAPAPVVKDGMASTSIDAAVIKKALEESDTIIITVPKAEGAKAYTPILPASVLASGNASKKVVIITEFGKVYASGNMLKSAEAAGKQEVSLTIAKADTGGFGAAVRAEIGTRPVLDLYVSINGTRIFWNNPEAAVTVEIPYQPTATELADSEHIVVRSVDAEGKVTSVPSGKYDAKTERVTFTTTHFSVYAVSFVHTTFTDLSKYGWAKKQIEVLASKGIITGTGKNIYSPQKNITRADFITLLVKTLGLASQEKYSFDDVKSGDYYYEAVAAAKSLGITQGVGGNKFNPKAQITRQDMMVMVTKALKAANKIKTSSGYDISGYTDSLKVSGYAKESIETLIKEGIITGSNNSINPTGFATRAEVAAVMYKLYYK